MGRSPGTSRGEPADEPEGFSCVQEFAAGHNIRELDAVKQLNAFGDGVGGKRLRYWQLVADRGLPSEASA